MIADGVNTYHFWIAKDQNYILTEQEFYLNSEAGYDRPGSPYSYSHINTKNFIYTQPLQFFLFLQCFIVCSNKFFPREKN